MFDDYWYSASQRIIPLSALIISHLAIIDVFFKEYVNTNTYIHVCQIFQHLFAL